MFKKSVNVTVILCCLAFLAPSVSASVGKSLVAHWKFDVGKGDSIKDSSANGIEGKIAGKVKWVEGKHGTAVEFDADGSGIITTSNGNSDRLFTTNFYIYNRYCCQ